MKRVVYFHRNLKAGFSINKVTQTFVSGITDKVEYYVPSERALPTSLLKNLWYVFNHRERNCINHITGDIHYCMLALAGCKSVLTVHDTVSVDYNPVSKMKRLYNRLFWFTIPTKIATKVVCISEETKRHLSKYSKRKDLEVIYNAIDPSFKTILKDQTKNPYKVLQIGTSANKNLERTILALHGINCELTIIGKMTQAQEALLIEQGVKYRNLFNLSDEDILKEYANSDIVSFISLFEGFGMPIIEANKTGRPVITSSIPVLKEIANDSAVFVNPEDIKEMHEGFVKLFNDSDLRNLCVERGLENVKRFEPSTIIRSWERLYESI